MASVDRELIADSTNYTGGSGGKAKEFIFIHYTAGTGGAYDNCRYFANNKSLGASAHYFIDDDETCRSVRDSDTAYAVGNFDMNQRSISIEVVSAGEDFSSAEIAHLKALVHELMAEHGIPCEKVLRHYDAYDAATIYGYNTGNWVDPYKRCPAPYIDASKWAALRAEVADSYNAQTASQGEDEMVCIIQPDGADCLMYFDGSRLHDLTNPDDVTALDMVYQATHNGASIPCFAFGTADAPWSARLYQSLYSKPPTEEMCPTLRQFPARNPDEE